MVTFTTNFNHPLSLVTVLLVVLYASGSVLVILHTNKVIYLSCKTADVYMTPFRPITKLEWEQWVVNRGRMAQIN